MHRSPLEFVRQCFLPTESDSNPQPGFYHTTPLAEEAIHTIMSGHRVYEDIQWKKKA